MGDMRKDYVSERFMIISKKDDKVIDPKKNCHLLLAMNL